jgi:hypothetical protein
LAGLLIFYLKKVMKQFLFLSAAVCLLWACNGAGTDVPSTKDTGNKMYSDSGSGSSIDSSHNLQGDSMKANGAKRDTTMRQ